MTPSLIDLWRSIFDPIFSLERKYFDPPYQGIPILHQSIPFLRIARPGAMKNGRPPMCPKRDQGTTGTVFHRGTQRPPPTNPIQQKSATFPNPREDIFGVSPLMETSRPILPVATLRDVDLVLLPSLPVKPPHSSLTLSPEFGGIFRAS